MVSEAPDQSNVSGLLSELIALAPDLAVRAGRTFAPLANNREVLQVRLQEDGDLISFPPAPPEPVETMCAIDGARVREQMYAADLLVSVATTADARSAAFSLDPDASVWADVVPHIDNTERLGELAMHAQEMMLAARAPHAVRILDGSFMTPIIGMREPLYVNSPDLRDRVADIFLGEWEPAQAFHDVVFPTRGEVIAVPKSDSATKYAKFYEKRYDLDLNVADRLLATQVLRPGELLRPRNVVELNRGDIREPEGSKKVHKAAELFRVPVDRLAQAARENKVHTTYLKPHGFTGSGQVIRIEFVTLNGEDPVEVAKRYASIINAETPAPHMLEPFCQWAVDKRAKQISAGTNALRASVIQGLSPEQAATYGALMAGNYRT